jgi:membrane protease YdiL (CAAX protease family)
MFSSQEKRREVDLFLRPSVEPAAQPRAGYSLPWLVVIFLSLSLILSAVTALEEKMSASGWNGFQGMLSFSTTAIFLLFVCWHRPRVLHLSTFHVRIQDVFLALLTGYLGVNVSAFTLAKGTSMGTLMEDKYAVLFYPILVPIAEEILHRGVLLNSLLERMPSPWAVLIISLATGALHENFVSALIAEGFLSALYVWRRRSLPSSIVAHMVMNGVLLFPELIVPVRIHYLKL